MYPYHITNGAIVVAIDGTPYTVASSHANYKALLDALRQKDWARVPGLVDVVRAIQTFADDCGVVVKDGEVFYEGYALRSSVTEKILALMEDGFDVSPLARFLARVQRNPLISAREELYDFCEANGFVIDEDGYILAYKAVRSDYKDIHSGTMDNSVGNTVSMPREKVDPDRRRECSAGLHFAAYGYAKDFGRGDSRLLVVRVDPADVVAVPMDYNMQKGRAWKYQVIRELADGKPLTKGTYARDEFQVRAPDAPDVTKDQIVKALAAANGVIGGARGAAAALNLTPSSLRRRMRKLGVTR